jgi:hypothetical protein
LHSNLPSNVDASCVHLERGGLASESDTTFALNLDIWNAPASKHARTKVASEELGNRGVSYSAAARIASGIRSNCIENGDIESSFIERDASANGVKVNDAERRYQVSSALELGRARVASRNGVCSRISNGSSDPRRQAMVRSRGIGLVQRMNRNAVGQSSVKPIASSRSIHFPRNSFAIWLV